MTTNTIEPSVTRVRFRERQLLRAGDLKAEQSYLITTRRRHNIGPHGWGIVSGLELTKTPDGILVQPGLAVDGYGRELIVPSPVLVPPEAFKTLKQKKLDVWLFYDLVETNVPQRGDWDCGPGRNTRNRERASIRLTSAPVVSKSDGAQASRTPEAVPFEDLPFPPSRTPPDDPAREWPVYLGTIRRRKRRSIYRKSPRAYASIIGELVSAASGTASMQVGSELESDTRRFAVSVGDGPGKWNERLAVDNDGNTVITGNTAIASRAEEAPVGEGDARIKSEAGSKLPTGRLRLRENKDPNAGADAQPEEPLCARSAGAATGDKPGSARMVHFESLAAEPAAAAPWSVYLTSTIQDKRNVQQLRFEIGHPGDKGDPKLSKLDVGLRGGFANDFLPRLTISADCAVTIEGDLEVSGELTEGAVTVDPSDPAFKALIADQWAAGTLVGEMKAGSLFNGITSTDLTVGLVDREGQSLKSPFIAPDEALSYAFLVRNNSSSRIINILLYVSESFRDHSQDSTLPKDPFNLEPNAELLIAPGFVFDPQGQEGEFSISVVVLGVSGVSSVVAGADSVLGLVSEPQPIP